MSNVSFGFVQSNWTPGTVSFGFKLASLYITYGLLVGETFGNLVIEERTTLVVVDEIATYTEADYMNAISYIDKSDAVAILHGAETCLTVEGWDHV